MSLVSLLEQLSSSSTHHKVMSSLELMRALDQWQGYPHRFFRSIHIAGTNGKGSVAYKISEALRCAGFSVGLYTSPHLVEVNERIVVNGCPVPGSWMESQLLSLWRQCQDRSLPIYFFPFITALAFQYFREQKVDFAVVETGLGGRLDATNVIQPILTVITSIGADHTHILGTTLEEIASEKAGILKPNVPCIIGPSVVQAPFSTMPMCIRAKGGHAFFDEENQVIARAALCELATHVTISSQAIEQGLAQRPSCRCEHVQYAGVDLILDVAHNPPAFQKLVQALHELFPSRTYRCLLGISKDKETQTMLALMEKHASWIHCVDLKHIPRLASAQDLAAHCSRKSSAEASLEEGMEKALSLARAAQEMLVITGSFYILGAVTTYLARNHADCISIKRRESAND